MNFSCNAVITLVGDGLYSENPSKFTKSRMIKGNNATPRAGWAGSLARHALHAVVIVVL